MSIKAAKAVKKDFAKTVGNNVLTVYFLVLLFIMYYLHGEVLNVGLYITYGHICSLVIIFSAFIWFLYTANISRLAVSLKSALIFAMPLFVMTMVSFYIWVVSRTEIAAINRGLSGNYIYLNLFSMALAMASLLMVFGEKAVWINFIALVSADLVIVVQIWIDNGIGPYMNELGTLILTFADETGPVIMQAEQHELVFAIGAYLLYFALYPPKGIFKWSVTAIGLFLFVSGLKRIAVISIVLSLLVCLPLKAVAEKKPKTVKRVINIVMTVLFVGVIAYVGAIKNGLFDMLEKAGLATMGRDKVYRVLNEYYSFSPLYIGKGMGNLLYIINTKMHDFSVQAPHNDFLLYFADLGFVGFILWLIQLTFVRIRFFGRNENTNGRIVACAMMMYLFIVSSTDNTFEYMLVMGVLGLLMMSKGYEHLVRLDEMRRYGTISAQNLGDADIDEYRDN